MNVQLTVQTEAALRNNGMTDKAAEKLTDQIANKSALNTLEMLSIEREEIENKNVKVEETWIGRDTVIMCRYCLQFSAKDNVPRKLSKSRKGNLGMVDMRNPDG